MDKATNLYAAFEAICPQLNAAGKNLTAKAVASAIVLSVLNDARDEASKAGKNYECLDWLIDAKEQQAVRAKIRDVITPFITAAKNTQNVHLCKTTPPLMPECKGQGADTSEFV